MKFFFTLIFCSLAIILFAQREENCASFKQSAFKNNHSKTRAGAYDNQLMQRYDVKFYFLDLHIERDTTLIDGAVTIGSEVISSTDTFCFELNRNLTIDSIYLNTQKINFSRADDITYALVGNSLQAGNYINLKIFYHGDAHVAGAAAIGSGFTHNNSNVWGDTAVFSLSQPYSAYEWFPCKQFLQDKADSARIYITTHNENMAGSNGILMGVDTLLASNQLRFKWKTNYPIDYYLISVAVAKYLDYTFYAYPASLPNDSVKIVNYMYRTNPQTLNVLKPYLDSVRLMMEYFSDIVGLYPFYKEKYGHCMTPFGGGMEHQTMTSTEYTGNFTLLAHELFHHWFGDYVTCKTWKDIYLNEGLASYSEYLAIKKLRNTSEAEEHMLTTHALSMATDDGSIYVTDTANVSRLFSWALTYNKGSAVTHTLHYLLGDSLFFLGLKNFLSQYAFSVAGVDDFQNSLENTTGKNLSGFFDQWIYGEGYPVYSAEYYSDEKNMYVLVKQRGSSVKSPFFETPLEILIKSKNGDTLITHMPVKNTDTIVFPYTKKITGIDIDPHNWILNTVDTVFENYDLITLSRTDLTGDDILMFPNPAEDNITLYNISAFETEAELIDANGRRIKSFSYTKKITIPVNKLSKGLYYVKLKSTKGKTVKKFLKR